MRLYLGERRGGSAVEFALVLPALVLLVMGLVDYGWMFTQQAQAVSALTSALRAGANIVPTTGSADGSCGECVDTATNHAMFGLQNLGIDVPRDLLIPSIEAIEGTCAMTLSVSVPHQPLAGLVPLPSEYRVEAAWMLLNVEGC